MWGKKDEPLPPMPVKEATLAAPPVERRPEPERDVPARSGIATIGKSVLVKGQLSGSEDLYIDGEVEGTVELRDHNLTVGPNGRVNADLNAKDIIVLGRVKGNVRATDRLEIRKSGSLVGDIITARVIIEDGAYFKGSIDIQKPGAAKAEPAAPPRPEVRRPETPPVSPAAPSPAAPAPSQGQFGLAAEPKKM